MPFFDDVAGAAADQHMARQGPIALHLFTPGARSRRQLPFYTDFLRGTSDHLICDVIQLEPRLRLPWCYSVEQVREGDVWMCPTIWLHHKPSPNGSVVQIPTLYEDLRIAVNQLAQTKTTDTVKYSLLVAKNGMWYDRNRLGGDCLVTVPSGRHFTFSVRRDERDCKLLLALAWT